MEGYRKLTADECTRLQAQGCTAEAWETIEVSADFDSGTVRNCGFRGRVRIGAGARLRNVGRIAGCDIGAGAVVEETSIVEATGRSSFGSGIPVAAVNEAGGREIPLFTGLTSQLAYIIAMYRHRPNTVRRLLDMAEREFTLPAAASLCTIGPGARISSCGILRNVCIGADAVVEGASLLSNGTVASRPGQRTYIGPGVKMRDFIVCGNSIVDNGTVAERCFFGNATATTARYAACWPAPTPYRTTNRRS